MGHTWAYFRQRKREERIRRLALGVLLVFAYWLFAALVALMQRAP